MNLMMYTGLSTSIKKDLIKMRMGMRMGQPKAAKLMSKMKGLVGKDERDVIRCWRERS